MAWRRARQPFRLSWRPRPAIRVGLVIGAPALQARHSEALPVAGLRSPSDPSPHRGHLRELRREARRSSRGTGDAAPRVRRGRHARTAASSEPSVGVCGPAGPAVTHRTARPSREPHAAGWRRASAEEAAVAKRKAAARRRPSAQSCSVPALTPRPAGPSMSLAHSRRAAPRSLFCATISSSRSRGHLAQAGHHGAGAGRDEAADDDVLLEAFERVRPCR